MNCRLADMNLSNSKLKKFYVFGSLFLLLSIITISSIMGTTDFDALYKTNFYFSTQLFLFYGVCIAFAVKTPVIFVNGWLLKAHVESPLGGSILLAARTTMAALYLAKCWKNHTICFIWSISRKLLSLRKGRLNYTFWDKAVFDLKYINSLLCWLFLAFCCFFKVMFMDISLINTWFKQQDFKWPILQTLRQEDDNSCPHPLDMNRERRDNTINLKLNRFFRGHTLDVIHINLNPEFRATILRKRGFITNKNSRSFSILKWK